MGGRMSSDKRAAFVAGLALVVAVLAAVSLFTATRHRITAAEPKASILQRAEGRETAKQRSIREKLARDRAELDRSFNEWKSDDTRNVPKAAPGTWGGMPRRLADQGNSAAQNWVGDDIRSRLRDYGAALPWYERAADQGDSDAMLSLAIIYANGDPLKKGRGDSLIDPEKALFWYRKSAETGNKVAMWILGETYEEGRLTTPDYREALKWYTLAAEAGDVTASIRLGDMYERGRGVQKNNVEVYKWYSIACSDSARFDHHPDAPVCDSRDELVSGMSSADVMQAQAVASEWEREHRK